MDRPLPHKSDKPHQLGMVLRFTTPEGDRWEFTIYFKWENFNLYLPNVPYGGVDLEGAQSYREAIFPFILN